jgi:hypothetical protein
VAAAAAAMSATLSFCINRQREEQTQKYDEGAHSYL